MENYKEKLRLAKEALDSGSYDKETIEYIFPELAESEDERIRKEIIQSIQDNMCVIHKDKCIAWLEKQGEQKPEIKYIYPKFRVGDVIEPAKPNGHYTPVRVKYIGEGNYFCESDDCKSFLSFPVCNENEYVLTEQQPVWSEEDEKMFTLCALSVKTRYNDGLLTCNEYEQASLWLKSLKERYSWKPSNVQMNALWDSIPENVKEISEREMLLDSLYQDLKKLRKE